MVRNGKAQARNVTVDGDFSEALSSLLGKEASGLSPTTITRLTAERESEYTAFQKRDL